MPKALAGGADLAELVRYHRGRARLSQEELAERAGISARAVSYIETGASSPRAITISLLAEALRLDASDRERLRLCARRTTAKPVTGHASHLPVGPERLIGRSSELAATQSALESATLRLLTLVGGPGVGKTSLALHLVRSIAANYDDVRFVDLSGLLDATFLPVKIALETDVREVAGETTLETFATALAGRRILVVLDTFETVASAAPFVAALLAAVPTLTIVATSRVPLHIVAEREFHVLPLAVAPATAMRLEDIAEFASVQLLAARAGALNPRFTLTQRNARSVAELTRCLNGVPLAIELAVPLLKLLSPQALAARLEKRLPLLRGQNDDLPPRQRTMRTAIAWSYELLDDAQARLFRRLAVFRTSFSLAGAAAVAGEAAPAESLETLRRIAALADCSLVQVVESDDDDDPRFGLLDLVREFAEERLRENSEYDDAATRLADYALVIAGSVTFRDHASHSRSNLDRIAREAANFDALRDWSLASGRIQLGLEIAAALWAPWWLQGRYVEPLGWLRPLLAAAEGSTGVSEAALATGYHELSHFLEETSALEEADDYADRALPLARKCGDSANVAALLEHMGIRACLRDEFDRGLALMREVLEMRRLANDASGMANTLFGLGQYSAGSGNTAAGADYLTQSLAAYRELGSELGTAMCLNAFASIGLGDGALERAESFAREALRISREAGYPGPTSFAAYILGRVQFFRHAYAAAREFLCEALEIQLAAGDFATPDTIRSIAAVNLAQGEARAGALLLGAECALRARGRLPMLEADREEYEGLLAAMRTVLGPEVFDTQWKLGESLPLPRILAPYLPPAQDP